MAYSSKLYDIITDLRGYFGDDLFLTAKSNKIVLDACNWLEENGYIFKNKPFLVKDYSTKVPVYGENHETTGKYEDWVVPELPFSIESENLVNPSHLVSLSQKGIVPRLTKFLLEKLASINIHDDVAVINKDLLDQNKELTDFIDKYAIDCLDNFLSWNIRVDGIYAKQLPQNVLAKPVLTDIKERLLPEEEVVKYNLVGFLNALKEKGDYFIDQYDEPEPSDLN